MTKLTDKFSAPVTGRSKIILVNDDSGGDPVGIVSEVAVLPSSDDKKDRLVVRGPVRFSETSKNHLDSVVLPLVDRIMDALGLPRRNYEVSIVNIGAAASSGVGMEIQGFSADIPVFLSLLSSSLQVPLRADIASTGHIGSLDGDIVPVRGIPAKLEAALQSPGIKGLVIPELEKDTWDFFKKINQGCGFVPDPRLTGGQTIEKKCSDFVEFETGNNPRGTSP